MADEWDALPDAKPKDEWDTLPDASAPAGQEDTAELPKPFLQRLQFGDAVRKLTNTLAKAPEVPEYEASPAAEKLLGLNGHTRFQTWPERMIRSGFTIAKDVIDGNVITGPGLRREDLLAIQGLPDDDTIPEPLDTLIERAGDMANFQLAGTVIPKGGPLFRTPDGKVARTVPDGESGIRGEVIGSPPKAADFDNAAKVIGEGEKFNAITITPTRDRLKTLWEEDGIHPSEAAAIADKDPFFKHDLTAPLELYHGSPHSFEAFDMGKIGTGEGAQSYGHGLYFAENLEVARSYQSAGKVAKSITSMPEGDRALIREAVNQPTREAGIEYIKKNAGQEQQQRIVDFINQNDTNLYKVKVAADPDHFMDWDKPLKEQTPYVKAALKDYLEARGGAYDGGIENSNATVGSFFSTGGLDQAATNALRDAGIKGTKYLDQGSRNSGEGSRNYVLFGDEGINIIEKNGQPVEQGLRALGAEVTSLPPDISPSVYPTAPSSRWAAGASAAAEKALDLTTSLRDMIAPMAGGTNATRVIAKDFAVALRRNRWDWSRIDTEIEKNFSQEARERIWNAMDEESVMQQRGEKSEHMGLATLTPRERDLADMLTQRSHDAWVRAYDAGLVRSEEGLPVYTPRMVVNTSGVGMEGVRVSLDGMGKNLRVATKQMMKREHMTAEETEAAAREAFGPQAKILRDIRTLPLATAKLEDAIAGRKMIDAIKEYGNTTGTDAVAVGFQPDRTWFTMDHPAFQEFKQRIGVKDEAGNPIYDKVPIYVHPDFEMPLRAVLDKKSGKLYQGLMDLKGRTMGLIMNSPAIHNFVEYGRAFPAIAMSEGTNGMGILTLKVYRDGFRAKHNVEVMHEAIEHGLDPIGKRFAFKQSVDGIMEEPNLTPGRSLTSQIASVVPDLFNPKAGDAVRRAIDKAGDFWHNTLLWDRIADLQMGLYVNLRDDLIRKGQDRNTASYMAAHMANRYAGALPKEAMSNEATKLANLMLFSRQFTIGNLGVFKDAVTGLPKDILAKIEADGGTINPDAAGYAKALARRKAISTIALDVALLYAGNTILQSAFNVMLGDRTLDQEFKGYIRRAQKVMSEVAEHPAYLLQPLDLVEKLSATDENEPGRKEKIKIGYDKDGTAIYMRQPFGKIGEEFTGWASSPLEKAKNKMSTIAKPTLEIFNNDKGFGRKIYDPDASTPGAWAGNIWAIVSHFMKAQLPMGQINALSDLVTGDGDTKVNALQAFGPLLGFTFSKGAPGGPAVGELYAAKRKHDFQVDMALPDIRRQIQRGDLVGAYERMNELQIPAGLQRYYVRTTLNPAMRLRGRTLRDFYNQATPDQIRRFEEQRRGWNGAGDE